MKILEDKGKTYTAVIADQFRQYYDQKNRVIEILPNFGINSQLNILFSSIIFYLDTGISYSKTIQIEELEINNLLNGAFNYKMNIEGGHDKKVELWKDAGTEVAACRLLLQARGYHSKYDWKEINFTWLMLYGDIIVNHCNSEVVTTGEHDANAILKAAWLEKEGLAKMFGINKDSEADDLLEKARERVGLTNDWYCKRYLLLTGKPCLDVNGNPYKIQSFNDIPYYDVYKIVVNETDRYFSYDIINDYYFDGAEEDEPFDFFSYDMITDYYLKSEEDEEENNSSVTKEEIPEEVMEEDTALQEKEKEDSGEVEGYEYLKQIDLVSMDGNVYPVMVPKDFERKVGDSFAVYYGNGFGLSIGVCELHKGETLTDFFYSISDFLYEDTDKDVVNVNKSARIEKDGLIYQISTADMKLIKELTSPQVRLVAAIPLEGTDVLKFQLEYTSYSSNQEGVKCLEEIGKYYKIPVDQFIELMEEYIAKKGRKK